MSLFEAIKPARFPWFDSTGYTFSLGLKRGDNAWLSGHSASEFDPETKHIVVRGGMEEQTRTAYAKIEAILEAAGHAFGDVHRVVEYVTSAGIDHYAEASGVRRSVFGEHEPAVCTVVVNRLLRPAALIEIEVTAGPPSSRTDGSHAPDGIVSLSSITAPGADLVAQTQGVFERAAASLEKAGLTMSNVVKTVDYTTPATTSEPAGRARIISGPSIPQRPVSFSRACNGPTRSSRSTSSRRARSPLPSTPAGSDTPSSRTRRR
jgi:enamine deaminase RidA (YjgF/YER057c/UK114 family)